MSELYSIQDTTLTALGDAVRNKSGVKYTTVDEPISGPFFTTTIDTSLMEVSYKDTFDMYEVLIDYKTLLGDKYDLTERIYATYNYEVSNKFCTCGIRGRNTETYQGSSSSNSHSFFDRPTDLVGSGSLFGRKLTFPYIHLYLGASDPKNNNYKISISLWACDANDKFIELNKYTPLEMVDAINNLDTEPPLQDIVIDANGTYSADEGFYGIGSVKVNTLSIPDEALNITGSGYYRFSSNNSNWLIDEAGDKIKTNNIYNASYMFYQSSNLKEIPFEINITQTASFNDIFEYCNTLENCPYIIGPERPLPTSAYSGTLSLSSIFLNCYNLKEIPNDFFWKIIPNKDFWDKHRTLTVQSQSSIFQNCYKLRELPDISMLGGPMSYYNHLFIDFINGCFNLNKALNVPIGSSSNITSNILNNTVINASRLKDFTFETNEDSTPLTVNWKSQTFDFSSYTGWFNGTYYPNLIGLATDKQVTDDATYQNLKNDEDWWSLDINYSRYNHDSAVNTINSLPDTSAYLSASGGTNTIKFSGSAGSKTDGGAINTLTEEEIAVATAKGWTVSLV